MNKNFTLSFLPFALMWLCVSCFIQGDPDPEDPPLDPVISLVIEASRLEGVAPLAVHFRALDAQSAELSRDEFLDGEFRWDFGNPSAGTWGTNGKSRNAATGAVAFHVFDMPGSYQVSLQSRSASGQGAGTPVTIRVLDPEEVYAGQKTICVSDAASNDFSGAPPGALCIATDDISVAMAYATAGRRLLFRRGSTWSAGDIGNTWPNNAGPVTLGAYGPGSGVTPWVSMPMHPASSFLRQPGLSSLSTASKTGGLWIFILMSRARGTIPSA